MLITLFLSNLVVCFFTKNKHDKSDRIFKNMTWTWLSLWVIEHHHVLACLKQWSYNITQLPNDQNRSTCQMSILKACITDDDIWNHLELQRKMKTVSLKNAFWHYLKRFGTAEIFVITMSLKHALWRYWKRFGITEKSLKTMSLKHAFWRRTLVETVWNCRFFLNNVSKECILMVF